MFKEEIQSCFNPKLQSVVSAISDPDTIVIKNRFWESENSNGLEIETTRIGTKSTRIDMSESGKESNILVLVHREIIQVDTALKISQTVGGPLKLKFIAV